MPATFNQQGQTVSGPQYNGEVINIGTAASKADLIAQLDIIRGHVGEAANSGQLDRSKQKLVDEHIGDALTEARKPSPDKTAIGSKLELATSALKGVVAVAGLYEALKKAAEVAGRLL